jgi:hypothetical protein
VSRECNINRLLGEPGRGADFRCRKTVIPDHVSEPAAQLGVVLRGSNVVERRPAFERSTAIVDYALGIGRHVRGIDVLFQVTQRDDVEMVVVEVLHIFLEAVDGGMHPRMRDVGHAVKLQYRDPAKPRLVDGPFEVVERPVGPRVAGRRNEERMVEPRLIGKPLSLFVRILGRTTSPRESKAQRFENRQRTRIDAVAWVGKHGRSRHSELGAAVVDRLDLLL